MPRIMFFTQGFNETIEELEMLKEKITRPEDLLRQVELTARYGMFERLLRGVDVEGKKFIAHGEGYARWKKKHFGTDQPLWMTGELQRQILTEPIFRHVWRAQGMDLEAHYNLWGGFMKHQTGDGVPQRRFFGFSKDDNKKIDSLLKRYARACAKIIGTKRRGL